MNWIFKIDCSGNRVKQGLGLSEFVLNKGLVPIDIDSGQCETKSWSRENMSVALDAVDERQLGVFYGHTFHKQSSIDHGVANN